MINQKINHQRIKDEQHDKFCYAIMDTLEKLDGDYVVNKIEFKKRIKSYSSLETTKNIFKEIVNIKNERDINNLKKLLSEKTPFEMIVEYIGAPKFSDSVETKSQIMQRLTKNDFRKQNINTPSKINYIFSYCAFAGSMVLGGMSIGSLFVPENHLIGDLLQQSNLLFPKIFESLIPQGKIIYEQAQGFSAALYGAIALSSAHFQKKHGKNTSVELESIVFKKSNKLADSLFGFELKKENIERKIDRMSESDKHLLNHLSPYELRVVFSSNQKISSEIIEHIKPSFIQKQYSLTKSESLFSYIGHMMAISAFPDKIQKKIMGVVNKFNESNIASKSNIKIYDNWYSGEELSKRLLEHRNKTTPSQNYSHKLKPKNG